MLLCRSFLSLVLSLSLLSGAFVSSNTPTYMETSTGRGAGGWLVGCRLVDALLFFFFYVSLFLSRV